MRAKTGNVAAAATLLDLSTSNLSLCATGANHCCSILAAAGLGDRLLYPQNAQYVQRVDSYWSVSAQLSPQCIIQPLNAQEVSLTVKTLVADDACRFAVRSGGHTAWEGSNNINDGVTIDLGNMNATTYHAENSTASILPGSRWLQVYQTLDALGVTVPGGRAGTVGTAGLIIGGGNSFYSARTGFVCDAVVNYEVVLASGEIIYAKSDTNEDLFRALKGGSSNFGIVTRFDLEAFKAPLLWGGTVMYNESHSDELLSAMNNFAGKVAEDPFSSSIIFWTYQPSLQQTVVAAAYENTAGIEAPPALAEYLDITDTIASTMRIATISNLTKELEQPVGYKQVKHIPHTCIQRFGYVETDTDVFVTRSDIWFTLSFRNDRRVLAKAVELHNKLVEDFKQVSSDGDFITQCMFQPLPKLFTEHSIEKGGNVLGLDKTQKDDGILWLATLAVKGADQELLGRQKMTEWVNAVQQYAASIDAAQDWIYLNYADKTQKPLESYGQDAIDKIRAAAKKYDPEGIFQTRSTSGFKISNVR